MKKMIKNSMIGIYLFLLTCLSLTADTSITPLMNAQAHLSTLSLREKIAQLCIVAAVSNQEANQEIVEDWLKDGCDIDTPAIEAAIMNEKVGGIIFYGNATSVYDQAHLINHFQSLSHTPLFIALDTETSLADRLDDTTVVRFPCAMAISAAADTFLTYRVGQELGKQLKALNIHIALSPVADVNNNAANPIIGMRSFGSDPHAVAQQAIAFAHGIQSQGVIACAKHFPGHGDTALDSHKTLPTISHDRAHLENIELYPFYKLINAGVQSIMTAHLCVPALDDTPGIPSSLSYQISTSLLQQHMGFKGLIITDALTMHGVTAYAQPGELELQALQAGADILLCPTKVTIVLDTIEKAVADGLISEELIDQKVLKVLTAKAETICSRYIDLATLDQIVTSEYAYQLQEEAYKAAITLMPGQSSVFASMPEEKKAVLLIKSKPSSFGLLEDSCIQEGIFYRTMSFTSSADEVATLLDQLQGFDHVFIITPCVKELWNAAASIDANLTQLKDRNKKVTTILCGTPYVAPLFKKSDTIIIAYSGAIPAQQAIAEVIEGTLRPTGILPVAITDYSS